jgi:2-octaprenyl-3-methyl-6-methoxy-1,4-benzoquinol hydroxylase/2-octaprenylphenol hydroxylase
VISVVGGGIMGALSALVAARFTHNGGVDWWAPPENPHRDDGAQARAYALAPQTVDLLKELGIWTALADKAQPVGAMQVFHVDPAAQVDLLASDAQMDALANIVGHADLLAACEQATQYAPNIKRRGPYQPSDPLSCDPALACPVGSQLTIAADGKDSRLRRAAGILHSRRGYDQMALVMAFTTEQPHGGMACQWFRPEGILALLPLRDPHQVSMVYSLPTAQAAQLKDQSPQDIATRIIQDSEHRFGKLIPLTENCQAAPLAMTTAERMTAGRLVLVGDAAHTVHPLAGYGLNLGVQDLLALRQALQSEQATHAKDFDPGHRRVLQAYANSRKSQVPQVQWGLDILWRVVMGETPGLAGGRSMGMQVVQSMPQLRKWLVSSALSGRAVPF